MQNQKRLIDIQKNRSKVQRNLRQKRINYILEVKGFNEYTTKLFKPITTTIENIPKPTLAIDKAPLPALTNNANQPITGTGELFVYLDDEIQQRNDIDKSFLKKIGKGGDRIFFAKANNGFITVDTQQNLHFFNLEGEPFKSPIKLTNGLVELLFKQKIDRGQIVYDDIVKYYDIMHKAGINLSNSNSNRMLIIRELENDLRNTPKPRIEEIDGEGMKSTLGDNIINNDRLKVLLMETKIGNRTDTFNEVNEILKELLDKREINTKFYKNILKEYYNI